jgi:hypothetical protein
MENPMYKLDPRRHMIVTRHPNRPTERRLAIGYWSNIKEGMGGVNFAVEIASSLMTGVTLPHPSNYVDKKWDEKERKMVVDYLNSRTKEKDGPDVVINWRGWSNCRMCGNKNGSSCVGDDKFIWPSGFAHYVNQHGVRPPREFIDHVKERMGLGFSLHSTFKANKNEIDEALLAGVGLAGVAKLMDRLEKAERENVGLRASLARLAAVSPVPPTSYRAVRPVLGGSPSLVFDAHHDMHLAEQIFRIHADIAGADWDSQDVQDELDAMESQKASAAESDNKI